MLLNFYSHFLSYMHYMSNTTRRIFTPIEDKERSLLVVLRDMTTALELCIQFWIVSCGQWRSESHN